MTSRLHFTAEGGIRPSKVTNKYKPGQRFKPATSHRLTLQNPSYYANQFSGPCHTSVYQPGSVWFCTSDDIHPERVDLASPTEFATSLIDACEVRRSCASSLRNNYPVSFPAVRSQRCEGCPRLQLISSSLHTSNKLSRIERPTFW